MKLGGRRLSIVPTAQHSTRGHAHPGQGKLSLGVSEPVDDENYTSEVDVGLARPAAVSSSAGDLPLNDGINSRASIHHDDTSGRSRARANYPTSWRAPPPWWRFPRLCRS